MLCNVSQRMAAIAIACLSTQALATPAGPPTKVIKSAVALGDSALPAQAMRGTGMKGQFDAAALDAGRISFSLADGRTLEATRQRVAVDGRKGQKSWVGTFPSQPGSLAVMSTARGVTTGFVTYGNETFEIVPDKAGAHVLYQVDESRFPKSEPIIYPETPAGDVAATVSDYGTGGVTNTMAGGGYVHDLLVVYTPASRARWGQAALESMIVNAVQAANQAYQNSNIAITLNLVGLQEIQYAETGDISTSVYALRSTTDGLMDGVHALRDSVGADVVSLISEDSSACGIAFTMRTESTAHASSAFSVVASACLSQHSLAHEIGHVQGNQHDRASSTNVGVFPYSYGMRVCDKTDGSGFRTVMAYPCTNAPRVTQFSNPNITYNGYPTGIAYETDPVNSADNARSMNNTADTVEAFRVSKSTVATSTTPAAPSGLATSAVAYNGVTIRWTDNASDETGFKVERSADGVAFAEIASVGADVVSFADNTVTASSNYYYRVRAYNSAGVSACSNALAVSTPAVPPPPPVAPASVSALNGADGSATVAWVDASTNESSFEVRREKWDGKRAAWTGLTIVGTVPANLTSMVDVSGNGTFRYSVRALNSGGCSALTGPASVTVTGAVVKGRK